MLLLKASSEEIMSSIVVDTVESVFVLVNNLAKCCDRRRSDDDVERWRQRNWQIGLRGCVFVAEVRS